MHAILTLYGLIQRGEITRRRETSGAGAGVHVTQQDGQVLEIGRP